MKIGYYYYKILSKIFKDHDKMNNYYRKTGAKIGKNTLICSNIADSEACLIEIGDNSTISVNVSFVTHDYSIHNVSKDMINLFGKIVIGNNCFIGERSIIMYGVELSDNVIVAAGSVVTHSFDKKNIIIGGNPAKIIGTWEEFYEKNKNNSISKYDLKKVIKNNPEKLVSRCVKK